MNKFEVGSLCYYNGKKAVVELLYKDAPAALILLFPQPDVHGDCRYQKVMLDDLVAKKL